MEARYAHYVRKLSEGQGPTAVLVVDPVGIETVYGGRTDIAVERLDTWHAGLLLSAESGWQLASRVSGRTTDAFWSAVAHCGAMTGRLWILSIACRRVWPLLGLWEGLERGLIQTTLETQARAAHSPPESYPATRHTARNAGTAMGSADAGTDCTGVSPSTSLDAGSGCSPTPMQGLSPPALDATTLGHGTADTTVPVVRPARGQGRGKIPLRVALGDSSKENGLLVFNDPPNFAVFYLGGARKPIAWVDGLNFGLGEPSSIKQGGQRVDWMVDWWRGWTALCGRLRLGGAKMTIASQAAAGWRRSYLSVPVHCHVHPEASQLEEESYHGGRAEAFRIGLCAEPVWELDASGFYGWVSGRVDLPCELHQLVLSPTAAQVQASLQEEEVIARVLIETREPAYPVRVRVESVRGSSRVLPLVRPDSHATAGITVYPVGRFWTTLASPELRDAIAKRRVKAVAQMATYGRGAALKDYAAAVMSERMAAQEAGRDADVQSCKLLVNCVPGRLGQRRIWWESAPDQHSTEPYGAWEGTGPDGQLARYRSVAWRVERERVEGFAADSIPAIASWICAAGRIRLLHWMRLAGRTNVVYCDTDGLLVTQAGYIRLVEAGQVDRGVPGWLRTVQERVPAEILGIKWVRVGGKVRMSGVPQDGPRDSGLVPGQPIMGWIARAVSLGQRPEPVRELRCFTRPATYQHGVVCQGGVVRPWRLREP